MNKKMHSVMMLTLLLTSMLTLAFSIQPAKAGGTIYIRADGSIDPPDAPISTIDNVTYTFTDNIYDSIIVKRDNIVINGEEHLLQGPGSDDGIGIDLSGRTNVTVEDLQIIDFSSQGIRLSGAHNNTIFGNNITNNGCGTYLLSPAHYNTVSGNHIEDNQYGVYLEWSKNNVVSGNNITNNNYGIYLAHSAFDKVLDNIFTNDGLFVVGPGGIVEGNMVNGKPLVYLKDISRYTVGDAGQVILVNCNNIRVENLSLTNTTVGIELWKTHSSVITNNKIAYNLEGIYLVYCRYNIVSGNNIANNGRGVFLQSTSSDINKFFHNNFINNTFQTWQWGVCTHTWDDGYPSGGNYWSDYEERYPDATELDGSGIWNTPYVIDANNQDNYPLMEPWTPTPPIPTTIDELKTKIEELGSVGEIDNRGIVKALLAKLNVAQKLVDKGKIDQAKSILEEDFIPQVQNLTDIHITPEAADTLIESAEYIISHL